MQIELTLKAPSGADYSARDLGYLLHKNPDHLHERSVSAGRARVFFATADEDQATAVLHLDVDPVALVRGKSRDAEGLLDQYVNDRPYVANSFLSVAFGRMYGTALSGKSKERQALADRALPLSARIVPMAVSGGVEMVRRLFEPISYMVEVDVLDESGARGVYDVRIAGEVHLAELLRHLYLLVPVLDDAKHWFIGKDEVEQLLAKGEGWLPEHPEKELITARALKHRRALVTSALERLGESEDKEESKRPPAKEEALEKPLSLHQLRLDTVVAALERHGAASVLDLGCGEGRLLERLLKSRQMKRIVGVDASVRALEVAHRRLRLEKAGDAIRERLQLQLGSLTYADRRWAGFDAAALVEVIEHIDPPRLSALELSLFGEAQPGLVVVTTPNADYNVLFDSLTAGEVRHPDHRFEWSRAEFTTWGERVAASHGYGVSFEPVGPVDGEHGAPSQMAVFTQSVAA